MKEKEVKEKFGIFTVLIVFMLFISSEVPDDRVKVFNMTLGLIVLLWAIMAVIWIKIILNKER